MTAINKRPRWASTDLRVATIGNEWIAISERGDDDAPQYLELIRLNPPAARRLAAELIAGVEHLEGIEK